VLNKQVSNTYAAEYFGINPNTFFQDFRNRMFKNIEIMLFLLSLLINLNKSLLNQSITFF